MVQISLPRSFEKYTNNSKMVTVDGVNVGQAIQELVKLFPSLDLIIFTKEGRVQKFINIYVDEENIKHLNDLNTSLKDKAIISIIPAIAGG